ncbi:Uncharacterized protein Adt_09365 [Abeliophyllum distichum]|uniref:Uncharacterized protein n=1 Tax=Abeliophyllum distichum TaxID=126358 RepID=A0ABD1UGZ9_9LAMI
MMGRKIAEAMSNKSSRQQSMVLEEDPFSLEGKDELLKDFIARFNRATLGIKELQMSTVVTAMMSGTRNRHFKMSLSKNPPNTMHELLRRGEKYVDAEEAYLITKSMKDRSEPESNKRKIPGELEPQNNRGKLTQDETR